MSWRIGVVFLVLIITGCGTVKKRTTYGKARKVEVAAAEKDTTSANETSAPTPISSANPIPEKADQIINTALSYSGVKYKYGGTSVKGMDCSGLLYVSFSKHQIDLPRTSHLMADEGKRIRIEDVNKGDLLFFKTSSRGKRINHVGLVVSVKDNDIRFIHATTSRGVVVSSLREGFWNYAFVKAARIL
ncbi:MAG: C40 family peptidase [Eudoraea sp.]|nr:C40 family peptidase [Eudoraea sp.]MBT8211061.1 C40 family peptidase [Eudoraea sp.]NNK29522.1 C40 family peptidase [Flavobacteriaceae bacterium]